MPNYRRYRVPGGTFFFTVNLADRSSRLLTDRIGDFRRAYASVARERPFETVAACVLPNHLHTVWSLPEGDTDYSLRWQLIKTRFTRAVPDAAPGRRPGERAVWQRRFYERWLRTGDDRRAAVAYVHGNPVKHRLVQAIDDWPHSTWHDPDRRRSPQGLAPLRAAIDS